jgi:multidrug efflux pump subunit AcrA (membrane-fusion protein)
MTYLKPTLNGSYFSALVLTLGTLILGSGISGCGKPGQSAETAPGPRAFPVKVVTVQAQLVPDSTDYLATLKSRTASALQPQVEGQVTKIYVHSGQKVGSYPGD